MRHAANQNRRKRQTWEYAMLIAWVVLAVAGPMLAGCAYNPCRDNPRNMGCMSADDIRQELAEWKTMGPQS